jgi:hypothetical protein
MDRTLGHALIAELARRLTEAKCVRHTGNVTDPIAGDTRQPLIAIAFHPKSIRHGDVFDAAGRIRSGWQGCPADERSS